MTRSLIAVRSFLVVAVTAASIASLGIDLVRTATMASHTVVLVAKI